MVRFLSILIGIVAAYYGGLFLYKTLLAPTGGTPDDKAQLLSENDERIRLRFNDEDITLPIPQGLCLITLKNPKTRQMFKTLAGMNASSTRSPYKNTVTAVHAVLVDCRKADPRAAFVDRFSIYLSNAPIRYYKGIRSQYLDGKEKQIKEGKARPYISYAQSSITGQLPHVELGQHRSEGLLGRDENAVYYGFTQDATISGREFTLQGVVAYTLLRNNIFESLHYAGKNSGLTLQDLRMEAEDTMAAAVNANARSGLDKILDPFE